MNHDEIAKNLSDNIDTALFEQYGAEWKRRAEQAEADRKVLAEEVEAWRCEHATDVYGDGYLRFQDTINATNASGALNRAKGTEP